MCLHDFFRTKSLKPRGSANAIHVRIKNWRSIGRLAHGPNALNHAEMAPSAALLFVTITSENWETRIAPNSKGPRTQGIVTFGHAPNGRSGRGNLARLPVESIMFKGAGLAVNPSGEKISISTRLRPSCQKSIVIQPRSQKRSRIADYKHVRSRKSRYTGVGARPLGPR